MRHFTAIGVVLIAEISSVQPAYNLNRDQGSDRMYVFVRLKSHVCRMALEVRMREVAGITKRYAIKAMHVLSGHAI